VSRKLEFEDNQCANIDIDISNRASCKTYKLCVYDVRNRSRSREWIDWLAFTTIWSINQRD